MTRSNVTCSPSIRSKIGSTRPSLKNVPVAHACHSVSIPTLPPLRTLPGQSFCPSTPFLISEFRPDLSTARPSLTHQNCRRLRINGNNNRSSRLETKERKGNQINAVVPCLRQQAPHSSLINSAHQQQQQEEEEALPLPALTSDVSIIPPPLCTLKKETRRKSRRHHAAIGRAGNKSNKRQDEGTKRKLISGWGV